METSIDWESRTDGELLALIAREADPMLDLLGRAGGLEALARASDCEVAAYLTRRDPDALERRARSASTDRRTLRKARSLGAAFELGRRVEIARARRPDTMTSAEDVAAWAGPRLGALTHEELWLLALDGRGRLRAARCVAKGGLHGAAVQAAHPIRVALRFDASAFVLVHNHPSGDPTPSHEDVVFTARIAASATVTGVPLLDHVVVAGGTFACVPLPPEDPTAAGSDGIGR